MVIGLCYPDHRDSSVEVFIQMPTQPMLEVIIQVDKSIDHDRINHDFSHRIQQACDAWQFPAIKLARNILGNFIAVL